MSTMSTQHASGVGMILVMDSIPWVRCASGNVYCLLLGLFRLQSLSDTTAVSKSSGILIGTFWNAWAWANKLMFSNTGSNLECCWSRLPLCQRPNWSGAISKSLKSRIGLRLNTIFLTSLRKIPAGSFPKCSLCAFIPDIIPWSSNTRKGSLECHLVKALLISGRELTR